jgi:hypothetical protein
MINKINLVIKTFLAGVISDKNEAVLNQLGL